MPLALALRALLGMLVFVVSAAAGEQDARPAERLLRLDNGRVLRAQSRCLEGRWQIRGPQGWTSVASGESGVSAVVQEHQLVEQALSEARAARREAARQGAAAEAQVLVQMFDAGLSSEALFAAEELLAADPELEPLRAFVARPEMHLGVPDWDQLEPAGWGAQASAEESGHLGGVWEPLFAAGARGSALLRERAVQQLLRAEGYPRRSVEEALRVGLEASDDARRAFACFALRRLVPGAEVDWMQQHAILDRDVRVRTEAARALRDARDADGILPLVALLDDEHPVLRERAAEGLAQAGYAQALGPLVRHLVSPPKSVLSQRDARQPSGSVFVGRQIGFVQGFSGEVAASSAVAEPRIGVLQTGAALDARVTLSGGGSGGTRAQAAVREALVTLSGEDFRSTVAWERWWEREGRARFAPDSLEARAATKDS